MDPIADLERQLAAARLAEGAALGELTESSCEAFWEAHSARLDLERQLAAARGEEHAVPVQFPARWDSVTPMPHLLRNGRKTLLIFLVDAIGFERDGSIAILAESTSHTTEPLAIVEFTGCEMAKLGSPDGEVFEGHPLSGRGLEQNTAQRVVNSRWIAELNSINSVHRLYDPNRERHQNHYIFCFHDDTFECIAESFHVEVYRESFADVLARACRRLLG